MTKPYEEFEKTVTVTIKDIENWASEQLKSDTSSLSDLTEKSLGLLIHNVIENFRAYDSEALQKLLITSMVELVSEAAEDQLEYKE